MIADLIAAETTGHKGRAHFGHEDPQVRMDVHERAYNRGAQDRRTARADR